MKADGKLDRLAPILLILLFALFSYRDLISPSDTLEQDPIVGRWDWLGDFGYMGQTPEDAGYDWVLQFTREGSLKSWKNDTLESESEWKIGENIVPGTSQYSADTLFIDGSVQFGIWYEGADILILDKGAIGWEDVPYHRFRRLRK